MKKEKLKFIDKIINTLNAELHYARFPRKKNELPWHIDEYINGFNSAIRLMKYNLKLERELVEHNCSCGYDLSIKLKKYEKRKNRKSRKEGR